MSMQKLPPALMGDFQKQLSAKLMARQMQEASSEHPTSASSPPPPPPPPSSAKPGAAVPPVDAPFPPPPPSIAKPNRAPFLPPPPPVAKSDRTPFPPATSDVQVSDPASSNRSEFMSRELRERNTTRYQNPGWESNLSRSRTPISPEAMQFQLQLEQQLQKQKENAEFPPPPPPSRKDADYSHNGNEMSMHAELSSAYDNEKFLKEMVGSTVPAFQRQWSKPDQGKPMYCRLHEYVHGVPIGQVLMLNEIDRAMALEAKFTAMREIFLSVGFTVDW